MSFSVNDIWYMISSSRRFTSRTSAVAWGIGHTKASVEACAEACRAHKANPSGSASLIFQAHPRCHLQLCVRGRMTASHNFLCGAVSTAACSVASCCMCGQLTMHQRIFAAIFAATFAFSCSTASEATSPVSQASMSRCRATRFPSACRRKASRVLSRTLTNTLR